MSQPRIEMNATILPSGKVLAVGGSRNDEDAATASLNADLFDPVTNTFAPAGANVYPRLYHSGSLLLPDATVLLAGGNPARGTYETHMEIYSPAYLFNADGTRAVRPTIGSVGSGSFSYGSTFQIQTPDAADISSVVLVRPGAPTHAFDMDQRLVGLSYSLDGGALSVVAPPDGNIAPPGYYMLFILNAAGVPSNASFVQVHAATANQAPAATITSPSSDATINPGESVAFAGTGSDPDGTITAYAWSFPGGNPASSALPTPGNVGYSTPGTYTASLRTTDNGGLTSPLVTRSVTVSSFSLSATPSSGAVLPGGGASYTATVATQNGFTGTVTFSVTGLPSGASATFTPASIAGPGTTTMQVSTGTATPAGSYALTVTGTSGSLVKSANVTLVVNVIGDFSLSATPSSRTIVRAAGTTYSVTVTALQGFSGSVNLSVDGLPKFVTASFSPTSIAQSGTSVLTVASKKQTKAGTYTLSITGSSGGTLVRSTNVVLIVQ
jgi:hypothetical protein